MSKRIAGIALMVVSAAAVIGTQLAVIPAAAAPAPCSVAPTVSTTSASGLTATGATVSGTINPEGCATTYQFEYGGTTAYGASTTSASAGTGVTGQTVTSNLTGLTPNTTYHVRLVAMSTAGTTDGKDATFTTPVSCAPGTGTLPAVVTGAASGITATDATLHGTVNPNGCATSYDFEYGPTTAYGTKTTVASAGSGASAAAVSASISGLSPNTTYHARLVASSAVGVTDGPDVTFTTAVSCAPGTGAAPTVATGAVTAITASGATVAGSVTPHGCATTYQFQYGLTTAYGTMTPSHNAGSGTTAVGVSASISGLASATTYHARLIATNAVGTTVGNDVTFTTPADCRPGKAEAPSVVTGVATAIGQTSATLTAAINAHGCPTEYRFEYGLSTAYGSVTGPIAAGAGTTAVPVSASVGGLAPNTVYHYRIVAANGAGTSVGADGTFPTAAVPVPMPPTVTLPSPSANVAHGFILQVAVGCSSGGATCQGTLRLFRGHRPIGTGTYMVSANTGAIASVQLNGRGRRAFRTHRVRLVEVVARGQGRVARRYVTAVRQFQP